MIDPQPCGIGEVTPPLDNEGGTLSITPGDDGQILATEDGVVQWVDPGAATGEVSSIIPTAPLAVDQPNGNVTISIDAGSDGDVLTTTGGVVGWAPPTGIQPVNAPSIVYGTNAGSAQTPVGYASALQPEMLVFRDFNGRAQVADPAVAADIATKGYVDTAAAGLQGDIDTNTADIATNTSNIGGLVGEVAGLETAVGNVEAEAASKVSAGGGVTFTIWAPIGAADPTPVGAVDGDVILRLAT